VGGFSLNTYYNQTGRWSSDNSSIATVTAYRAQGVAPGTTMGRATATIPSGDGGRPKNPCPQLLQEASAPVPVSPQITSISPNFGQTGSVVPVVINGSGFGSIAAALSITGLTATISGVSPDGTRINASFDLTSSGPGGYSVAVSLSNGDGGGLTSNSLPFTVNPVPIPINFRQTNATDEGGGYLRVTYQWDSSTGNLSDLSACQVREYVTYPTSGDSGCPAPNTGQMCYWPPSPPWPPSSQNGTGYVNPTVVNGPATAGGVYDSNTIENLNFVKPYSASSFQATQVQQYSCNGSSWAQFGGPFTITRQVMRNSNSQWEFSISKTGVSFSSTYVLP